MEATNLKLAKLAMEIDSNIIGNCFISNPEKSLGDNLGILFGISEIYNINDIFIDGFLEAINDLKTEYYLPPFSSQKPPEKRFEEAIARTNRRILSAINQSVEEVDLRNISAILGIMINNKIFISATGRIKGFFFRRKKNGELIIADILSVPLEKRFKPEPEKVFANIISGDITSKDTMLFVNEEFLNFFSQAELANLSLDNNSDDIIKLLNQSLQEKIIKNNFYSIAIRADLDIVPTDNQQKEIPISQAISIKIKKEEEISKDEAIKENKINKIKNNYEDQYHENLHVSEKQKLISEQDIINEKLKANPERQQPQKSLENLLDTQTKTEKYLTPSMKPNWQKILLVIKNGIKKSSIWLFHQLKNISINSYSSIKNFKNKDKQSENTGEQKIVDLNKSSKTKDFINSMVNNKIVIFLNLRITQKIALILGFILLFIFMQSLVIIGRSYEKTGVANNYEEIIKQIENQLNKAEAQNIFNDEIGAIKAINEAKLLLSEIPAKRATNNLKEQLDNKVENVSNNIQRIVKLEANEIFIDFQEIYKETEINLTGLAKTNKLFWLYDNKQKALIKFDTLVDSREEFKSNLTVKKLSNIDEKNLILLTENGDYYKYEIAKNSFDKISKPSKEYFLLTPPKEKLPLVTPELTSENVSIAFSEAGYSLFLDNINNRLVILDKNNNLKRQYYSKVFEKTDFIVINDKEKKIWLLSENKIYQIEIDF